MSALHAARVKAVHVAKSSLQLDDAAYRDLLQRVTGQRSAKDCTSDQLAAVMAELQRQGARFARAAA